ncbi:MAG: Aspartate--tRNA ligase [Microgenomates bacterium OLB22]|nr:MAG: Aspartate--tRNA ligase [Microgenomates bacterium OLB22]
MSSRHGSRQKGIIVRSFFLDLRDRTGIIQCVGGAELKDVPTEGVLKVKALIKERPERMINPHVTTGSIELEILAHEILSRSETIPFPIDTDGYEIDEELRLRHRYIDLRRTRMTHNMLMRSKVLLWLRNYLSALQFVEIETPILTKSTPEGARDFVVPSRLQQGKWYALPQSPQQYKQMLMVAGFERYFQVARCFRDEDPRADRAYGEFTQLDIEMSFVSQEDLLRLTEDMFTSLVRELFPEKTISASPWPRLSHALAQEKYQTDKPDLRKDPKNPDELAFCWVIDYPLFTTQSKEDYFHGSGSANLAPSHHMFTAPHPDDVTLLDTAPAKVRGLQHDLVLNGFEVGGGSIRIHDPVIQQKVFDIIGFSKEDSAQFGYLMQAFSYGVPPHGGIAPGIDRFLMALLGEPSVREVIAFPMTSGGTTAVMDAPSMISLQQSEELGLLHNGKKTEKIEQKGNS